MTLYTGKKPATYDSRDIRYSAIGASSTNIPYAPVGGGYGTDFGFTGWGMLGNGPQDDNTIDSSWAAAGGAGCCVWSGAAHETEEAEKNAKGTVAKFTCLSVLEDYSKNTGYDLKTGANDNGTDVREAMKYRQKTGIKDADGNIHKIGVYISLEPANLKELWEALHLFEAVGIGIEFPSSAMDQFNNGNEIWSVVNGAEIDGGHYIPIVGHPTRDVWTCVTWGDRQTMTPQFITKYCDEAWAFITSERYNQVTGETLEKYTDADLEKYVTMFPQGS